MTASSISASVSSSLSRHSSAGLGVVGRDLDDVVRRRPCRLVVVPEQALHPTRSTTPREVGLDAPRELEHERGRVEAADDHVDAAVEVGAGAVQLVDEADARDVVLVGLAPHRLGLRLDAGDAVEDRDRAVEDAQRALDLDGEVDVARGVDDVDRVVVPLAGRRGGRDRDAALLLLLHPVHRGGAVVDLADLVVDAGVEQDPLGRRGLARVDVRHDPDVAGLGEDRVAGHCCFSSLVCRAVLGRSGLRTTSGSARRPCWTRPSCGCPRAA